MCGIMGYVGNRAAWPIVMSGLKRLEYRGYDSAGACTVHEGSLKVAKRVGHLSALDHAFPDGLPGMTGIGHTRWATHGGVTERNCHPHLDGQNRVAIVHTSTTASSTTPRSCAAG
jgi:glucosamine--fructose-6-phosphate aminotransferase (isomerizing)